MNLLKIFLPYTLDNNNFWKYVFQILYSNYTSLFLMFQFLKKVKKIAFRMNWINSLCKEEFIVIKDLKG